MSNKQKQVLFFIISYNIQTLTRNNQIVSLLSRYISTNIIDNYNRSNKILILKDEGDI